jgi:hypothetical protein
MVRQQQEPLMRRTFLDRVSDYHRDPFFPTLLALAIVYALRDVWSQRRG